MPDTVLAIVSGGVDSVTMAYYLKSLGWDLEILSFDYGQKHFKELYFAERCAAQLDARFDIVRLGTLGKLLENNSLTGDLEVPDGSYSRETIQLTVVPNRNAIMLAIAYGVAASRDYQTVAIGVHTGDHPIYPDCRPEFLGAFLKMVKHSLPGLSLRLLAPFVDKTKASIVLQGAKLGVPYEDTWSSLRLLAPFVDKTKASIVLQGAKLGVPYEDTWSCYKGGVHHCGVCSTCVERKEAFILAGVDDPTYYSEPLRKPAKTNKEFR